MWQTDNTLHTYLALCRLEANANHKYLPIYWPLLFSSSYFFSWNITFHFHLLDLDSIFKIHIKFSASGKPASPAFLVPLGLNCIILIWPPVHSVILRPAISYHLTQNAGILELSSISLLLTICPSRFDSQKALHKVDWGMPQKDSSSQEIT